jgi:hypothetical protein
MAKEYLLTKENNTYLILYTNSNAMITMQKLPVQ